MWFNLEILKSVINVNRKVVYWRSYLLISNKDIWNLDTLFFRKRFNYKFTFARKVKKLLITQNESFTIYHKKNQLLNTLYNFINNFIFCYFLVIKFFDYLLFNKYYYLLNKYFLLKQNYVYLFKDKQIYNIKIFIKLNNFFLLYKYFFLSEKLVLYFDLYVFYVEAFFFNFEKLTYFLKYFFLRKCSAKWKLKIWDECEFTVHKQYVFFADKSVWLKNLEIFEEQNSIFFDQISLDKVFLIWDLFRSKITNERDNNFKYLYYKFKFLIEKLNYIEFKIEHLKKKKKKMQNYLQIMVPSLVDNNRFFFKQNILEYLSKNTAFLNNRKNLLKLIYFRRKKFCFLRKVRFIYGNEKIKMNVLNNEKKTILYVFFLIIFQNYFKKYYLKNYENFFLKFKKKFKLKKNLRKKTFLNYKFLFFLFFKLDVELGVSSVLIKNKIFLFSFFFLYIEKKLLNVNKNYIDIAQFSFVKKYLFTNITEDLFLYFWKVLIVNFALEVDNYYTKRYDYLYQTLYLSYKKYWFSVNINFLNLLKIQENILLKKLNNLEFFFSNFYSLKKLYDIYILFSFDIWTFDQYKNLMGNIFKVFKEFLKLKKKIYWNKTYMMKKNNLNIFYKNKNLKKLIILKFMYILKKKIKSVKYAKKNNIFYVLYFMLKKKFLTDLLKFSFLTILKLKWKNDLIIYNKKISLFLKINFSSNSALYYDLDRDHIKQFERCLKNLLKGLLFIFILKKFKNFKYKKNKSQLDKFVNFPKNISKNLSWYYFFFYLHKRDFNISPHRVFFPKFYSTLKVESKNLSILKIKNKYILNLIHIINSFINKRIYYIAKLYFFLQLIYLLYENFIYIFKQDLVIDLIVNVNNHFLSTITFFDLQNDFSLPKKNFDFVIQRQKINFYINKRYNYFNRFWWKLKSLFFFEYLNILINNRVIFIIWFNVLNDLKLKYRNLVLDDYLFLLYMEYNDFDLDSDANLKNINFSFKLTFIVQLFLSYVDYCEQNNQQVYFEKNCKIRLINKNLLKIDNYIDSYTFYLKTYFLKFIALKKNKFKKYNFVFDLIYNENLYFKLTLEKKKYLSLKCKYFDNIKNMNENICISCNILCVTSSITNQILYYQKLLKLNLINKNILKFNFISCNKCGYYKIVILEKYEIKLFFTYQAILKYFIKNNYTNIYIYYKKKIYNCMYVYGMNYIFFEELKFIDIGLTKLNLKFFFFYFKNQDKLYYNIKINYIDLHFLTIYLFFIYLVILNFFFKENYYLIIPKIVKMYDEKLILDQDGARNNEIMDSIKKYRKKNKIKITRKMKKEKKLFYLNQFFEAFVQQLNT